MTEQMRTKVSRGTLTKTNMIDIQSEKIEMTLNTDSAIASGLLIQRLTELYENPIEASVRETVSNALDALAVSFSGSKAEVRIESPSRLNPILTISDNGSGMTYDDLKNVYSKYGASTKQNNFDQIGAYGLGAKAPLAYGTQFTVSSVKDGQKTTIIVAREEMTNYIKVIDSFETEEPSGTTVSIPVQSSDIEKFIDFVSSYKMVPADYSVDMYIDGELVKNESWELVSDKAVLFRDGSGEVQARVWVDSNPSQLVELASSQNIENEVHSLKYVIGGWSYSVPSSMRGHGRANSKIYVELKPGLVAFNSSRDSILDNERYQDLNEKIKQFLVSDEFKSNLSRIINKQDISKFKAVVFNVLRKLTIHGKKNSLKIVTSGYHQNSALIPIEDFVHEETGYSISNFTKDVPVDMKSVAIMREERESYSNRSYSSVFQTRRDNEGWSTQNYFSRKAANEIPQFIYETFEDVTLSADLVSYLIQNLIAENESQMNSNVIFVTDVPDDMEEVKKVVTKRKAIIKYLESISSNKARLFEVVYTAHSKDSVAKMLKTSGLKEIKVENYSDLLEKVKQHAKENRVAVSKIANKDYLPSLSLLEDDLRTTSLKVNDINVQGKTSVIIMSKDKYIPTQELNMIKNWYCNKNDKAAADVRIISSTGMHRLSDLVILEELELEIYEYGFSAAAGNSKHYEEKYLNKKAGLHPVSKTDTNSARMNIFRLLSSVGSNSPSNSALNIKSKLLEIKELAVVLGIDLPEVPVKILDEIVSESTKLFGGNYSTRWNVGEEGNSQILSLIDEEFYNAISTLSVMQGRSRYSSIISIKDKDTFKVLNGYDFSMPDLSISKEFFEVESPSTFVSYEISRIKSLIGLARESIEFLNKL